MLWKILACSSRSWIAVTVLFLLSIVHVKAFLSSHDLLENSTKMHNLTFYNSAFHYQSRVPKSLTSLKERTNIPYYILAANVESYKRSRKIAQAAFLKKIARTSPKSILTKASLRRAKQKVTAENHAGRVTLTTHEVETATSLYHRSTIQVDVGYASSSRQTNDQTFPCRSSRPVEYKNYDEYARDTCALCYSYMVEQSFRKEYRKYFNEPIGTMYKFKPYFYLAPNPNEVAYLVNFFEVLEQKKENYYSVTFEKMNLLEPEKDPFLKVFKNQFYMNTFVTCCYEAAKCCNETLTKYAKEELPEKNCPAKWDGWKCWGPAGPGQTLVASCPDAAFQSHEYLPADCLRGEAQKQCTLEGSWHKIGNKEVTDYSQCSIIGQQMRARRSRAKYVLQSISIISIVIAAVIYIGYRQYRLVRVQIHLNFFSSFLLTSVSTVLLNALVLDEHLYNYDKNLLNENPPWCRVLYLFYKYGRLSNYFWMLCEGIYLHQLIVQPFHQQKITLHFYLIGWITPLLVMIPFTLIHNSEEHNRNCWTDNESPYLEWLFLSLPIFCWVVNTVLLINITRVLFRKLSHTAKHVRAAQRATATLLPVFGIHYIFYLIQPEFLESCNQFLDVLHYFGLAIDSLHGFAVVTIFCFCNAEIHHLVRRTIRRNFNLSEMLTEENDLERIGKF